MKEITMNEPILNLFNYNNKSYSNVLNNILLNKKKPIRNPYPHFDELFFTRVGVVMLQLVSCQGNECPSLVFLINNVVINFDMFEVRRWNKVFFMKVDCFYTSLLFKFQSSISKNSKDLEGDLSQSQYLSSWIGYF